MQCAEQNKSSTTQKLIAIRDGLPFEFGLAWMFSERNIACYLDEHAVIPAKDSEAGDESECDSLSTDATALMAAGRLNWLLRKTRPSLSGLLSERDIVALHFCFRGGMFFPDQFDSIPSDLCDYLTVALAAREASSIAELVDKLRDLSPVQRLTLADALEQVWYRGMKQENMSPKEFLATLGIDLT